MALLAVTLMHRLQFWLSLNSSERVTRPETKGAPAWPPSRSKSSLPAPTDGCRQPASRWICRALCIQSKFNFITVTRRSYQHRMHIFWLIDTSNNPEHKLIFDKKMGLVVSTVMKKRILKINYYTCFRVTKETKLYILKRRHRCNF